MDTHKFEHKTILTQVFTRTCKISHGRGNRTQKPNAILASFGEKILQLFQFLLVQQKVAVVIN